MPAALTSCGRRERIVKEVLIYLIFYRKDAKGTKKISAQSGKNLCDLCAFAVNDIIQIFLNGAW